MSDGIKGAAISALLQGLLMPLKVFLWNSLGFGLAHRRLILFISFIINSPFLQKIAQGTSNNVFYDTSSNTDKCKK